MLTYLLKRLVASVPTLLGVTLVIFSMVHLAPGDPVQIMLDVHGSADQVARLRHELGLDLPLPEQYVRFVWGALRGDLGNSLKSGRPAVTEMFERLPATLTLAVAGMSIAIALGLGLGVLAAARRGTWVDSLTMAITMLGVSLPSFWIGILLIYVFGVKLQWLPVAGASTWKHLILPAVTLGTMASSVLARMTRSGMLEVLGSDYIRTARSKGLPEKMVLYRHALKNTMIPVLTIIGVQVGSLLGGTFIIEQLYAWPGVGRLAVGAIQARDYPMVQAIGLYVALGYVLINLVVDLLYGLLDPRIRYA
jgi:peptide/nickel transport system permease protein